MNIQPLCELQMEPKKGYRPYVPSASGLVYCTGKLFVISDEENSIAVFDSFPGKGKWLEIIPGSLPEEKRARKAAKSDWEGISLLPVGIFKKGHSLLLVPSGSKSHRVKGALLGLGADGNLTGESSLVDFSAIYEALRIKDINVEGFVIQGSEAILFHRGNGSAGVCLVIRIRTTDFFDSLLGGKPFSKSGVIKQTKIVGGDIEGAPLTVTDACALRDGRLLCTLAAEGGDSTYEDGEVAGSAIGILEVDDSLSLLTTIEGTLKLEGVTLTQEGSNSIEGLLCSDADDRETPSQIFSFKIDR